ncbi:thioredoxin family protein [Fulvivirga sp. RKSG066]|uniref:thioredoxin family protein n=1 Tax=Fulvivirga aurantia TaxID=2529383 RepID=UPI0012BD5BC6|nr:thioredoxin family protein [Fulvivirga aurantia]MTI21286.1 thioredoxin family protein [Fulvivirga aurantia]
MIRFCCIFLLAISCYATATGQIKSYSFNELDSLLKIESKPVIAFIYTDWCRYCKAMENTTFRNDGVMSKIENAYYFIRLDAEDERPVNFGGQTYRFKPSGNQTGVHELAQLIGEIDGSLEYPTLIFFNKQLDVLYKKSGYVSAEQLLQMLNIIEANLN